MAKILMADDGLTFDGPSMKSEPLGGAERAFVYLAESLAARGHEVHVRNRCEAPVRYHGVQWRPISEGMPRNVDLYIANRSDRLIRAAKGKRNVFWVHNPARYLCKWRYIRKLATRRPTMVFGGKYHASTCPTWVPSGGRKIIPLAPADIFCDAPPVMEAPPPRAVFFSNPLRGLDWLLDLWAEEIWSRVENAELHIFSGPATYQVSDPRKRDLMRAVLEKARKLSDIGVVLRDPLPHQKLVEEIRTARALLYRGNENETYCMAVAEAQALGVPAVVMPYGSLPERVYDRETGFVAHNEVDFVESSIYLLSKDDLWKKQHDAAIKKQRMRRWMDVAVDFEALLEK